ncbi:MAG: PAS domain-containing protein [Deltaproteobacteria bacterium]|nr:PAS domain-containing protein [Deltaproteobacteria bacterium]
MKDKWLVTNKDLRTTNEVLKQEIGERKQAEEALQQSDNQVRLLLNSTAEAIYGLDMDGICTFANRACIQILGYKTSDELIGQNMHDLIHHSYPDATLYPVQKCPIFQAFQTGFSNRRIHSY